MKDFVQKIAALANEADEAGFSAIAKALDEMLTSIAGPWDQAGEMLDARHLHGDVGGLSSDKWDPAGAELDKQHFKSVDELAGIEKGIDDSFKAQHVSALDEKHQKVADHLRMIADLFAQSGQPAPFILPAGKITGSGLKAALAALGITSYASWADIHAKLNFFQASKFGAESLATGQIKPKVDMDSAQPLPREPKADLPLFMGQATHR